MKEVRRWSHASKRNPWWNSTPNRIGSALVGEEWCRGQRSQCHLGTRRAPKARLPRCQIGPKACSLRSSQQANEGKFDCLLHIRCGRAERLLPGMRSRTSCTRLPSCELSAVCHARQPLYASIHECWVFFSIAYLGGKYQATTTQTGNSIPLLLNRGLATG